MPTRLLVFLFGLLAGCTVYPGSQAPSPDQGRSPGAATCRRIAVLPLRVSEVQLRGFKVGLPDTATAKRLRAGRRQAKLAYQLQAALAARLVAGQPTKPYTVWVQPTRETNLRLEKAGITYDNLSNQPAARLQEILAVDALLGGQTMIAKLPLSVELTADVLLSKPLPTLLVTTRLTLQDARSEQPVWQTSFSSSEESSLIPNGYDQLASKLLQQLPPTFPYR